MKIFHRTLGTVMFLVLALCSSAKAVETVTVTTAAELTNYITRFNAGESYDIVINSTITLSSELPKIVGTGNNSLTIKTTSQGVIDGNGVRGLYIDTGNDKNTTISVEGIKFTNCVALGGNGGSGLVGGGGGMGAGGAIYVASGKVFLEDVVTQDNAAKGGNGGNVLQESNTYAGGGGTGGNGGSGAIGDKLLYSNGNTASGGGQTIDSAGTSTGGTTAANGGEGALAHPDYEQSTTGMIGGGGANGGGGGGSLYIGGNGGLGGGGGAGLVKSGSGGFGAGGAGGSTATSAGLGGLLGGNGGYVADETYSNGSLITGGGTGGGGAGLGGALYAETGASVSISYSKDASLSNNYVLAGQAGTVALTGKSGGAEVGTAAGAGYFFKSDLNLDIDKDVTFTIDDSIYGYDSASLIKDGQGTIDLNSSLSLNGKTEIIDGLLNVTKDGSLGSNSTLKIDQKGAVKIASDQTILDLQGEKNAQLDINGQTLKIKTGYTGNDSSVSYAGKIFSSNTENSGVLYKDGTGVLRLTGDNSESSFLTKIDGGSLIINNGNALGSGDIQYIRSNLSDDSAGLIFDGPEDGSRTIELTNNIILGGKKNGNGLLITSQDSAALDRITLSGKISTESNSAGILRVNLDRTDQIFDLTNTGVDTSRSVPVYDQANANKMSEVKLYRGTLNVKTDAVNDVFFSALGSAALSSYENGILTFDNAGDHIYFNNQINLESGWLSVKNSVTGQDLQFGGTVSGQGGLEVDLKDKTDLLKLTGTVSIGSTAINNGVLDITAANGAVTDDSETAAVIYSKQYSATSLGNLTAGNLDSAVVNIGQQILNVGSAQDGDYYGTIVGGLKEVASDGAGNYSFTGNTYASIVKVGSSTWGLSLKDNAGYVSNLRDITINAGAVKFLDNSTGDLDVLLNGAGTSLNIASTEDVTLSGKISSSKGKTTSLVIDMEDPSKTVTITNNGVSAGVYNSTAENNFSNVVINKGNLTVNSEKASYTDSQGNSQTAYFSGIGSAKIVNNGANNTAGNNVFTLNGIGSDTEDLYFNNNFDLASGLLTINNQANQNLHFGGTISGDGGIELDLAQNDDILYLSGKVNLGAVTMTKGVLDLTAANNTPNAAETDPETVFKTYYGYTSLGDLRSSVTDSSSNALINVGRQYLYVGSTEDGAFYGTITGSIKEAEKTASGYAFTGNEYTGILKTGTGTWTLGLSNSSNVRDINVKEGTLIMNDNSSDALKNIYITAGTLQVNDSSLSDVNLILNKGTLNVGKNTSDGKVSLANLYTQAETKIMIDSDAVLTLDKANSSYQIESSLVDGTNGGGTFLFENNYDYTAAGSSTPKYWTLNGDSRDWTGTIRIDNGTVLLTNYYAAGSENANIILGNALASSKPVLRSTVNNILGNIQLANDSTVQVAKGVVTTVAGTLSGPGNLTIGFDSSLEDYGGSLVFKSGTASDYSGNINVNRSVLKLTGDNRGTHGLTLNGGSLVMDYSNMTYADSTENAASLWGDDLINISGTGGGLEISGTSKNVIIANKVNFNSESSDPLVLKFTNTGKTTWTGTFENSEKSVFYKYGSGTLVLDGDPTQSESSFNGDFAVYAGTLQLGAENATQPNSQLALSDVTIGSSGKMDGLASEFNSLTVRGLFDVNNYNTTAGRYDSIKLNADATGKALSLYSGGTINLDAASKTNYQVIEATNGAAMEFNGGTINLTVDDKTGIDETTALKTFQTTGTVSGNLAALKLYDNISGYQLVARRSSTGVDLVFVQTNFANNASSANGLAVSGYLTDVFERNLNGNTELRQKLENAVYNTADFQERLSGSSQLSSASAQLMNLNMLRNIVTGQVIPYNPDSFGNSMLRGQTSPKRGLTGWVSGYGLTGSQDGSLSVANNDLSAWGTVIGVELGANATAQGGLFFSYGDSKISSNIQLGNAAMDNKIFGGYFRWNDQLGYGLVYANVGWTDYETNRLLEVSDSLYGYHGDYSGMNWNIYGERGYSFNFARCSLQPYFGLQYTGIQQDAYSESGSDQNLALVMSDTDLNSLQTSLGIRLTSNSGGRLNGYVYTNWLHELLDTESDGFAQLAGFQNFGTSYRLVGSSFGRDWFMAGVGAQFQYNEAFGIFGSCDLQTNEYSTMVTGNGGIRYTW